MYSTQYSPHIVLTLYSTSPALIVHCVKLIIVDSYSIEYEYLLLWDSYIGRFLIITLRSLELRFCAGSYRYRLEKHT